MIGEAAKRARVAMSSTEMSKWDNSVRWNGVKTPRTPRKSSVHTNLPVKKVRTTIATAATDTMMLTPILKSDGERYKTAAAKVNVAISVMTRVMIRVKMHAFGCRKYQWSRVPDQGVN